MTVGYCAVVAGFHPLDSGDKAAGALMLTRARNAAAQDQAGQGWTRHRAAARGGATLAEDDLVPSRAGLLAARCRQLVGVGAPDEEQKEKTHEQTTVQVRRHVGSDRGFSLSPFGGGRG